MSHGSLHVYVGPMASGKTTAVIDSLVKFTIVTKQKVLFINHKDDTRGEKYSTHCGIRDASGMDSINFVSIEFLGEVPDKVLAEYNVIGIDEAQFFTDLYYTVKTWIDLGKTLYVSGLDGDRYMKKFGQVSDLSHLADSYVKINAVCGFCVEESPEWGFIPAPFTKYIGGTTGDEQVLIGGLKEYQPSCRRHHSS